MSFQNKAFFAIAVTPAIIVLGACSSTYANGSSGSSVATPANGSALAICKSKAIKAADTDQSSSPFIPGPSINAKPLKGKIVAFVADSFSNPDDLQVYAGFAAAAKAAGMTSKTFNGNGNASGYVQAMTEAIAEKPAGIVMEAIDPHVVQPEIAEAKADGISLVANYEDPGPGFTGVLTSKVEATLGTEQADWALAATGCNTDAAYFYSEAFVSIQQRMEAAKAEFARLCPTCKLVPVNIDATTPATSTGPAVTTTLLRNPDINYVMEDGDFRTEYIVPALLGARRSMNMVGASVFPATLRTYVAKQYVEVADATTPPNTAQGWLALDQLIRNMLHVAPSTTDEDPPCLLIDASNIKEVMNVPGYVPAYTNIAATLTKDWGLG